MLDDSEMTEIWKIFKDFYWKKDNSQEEDLESFKRTLIEQQRSGNYAYFVIKNEAGEFIGFFRGAYIPQEDVLFIQTFNVRRDLMNMRTFINIFRQMQQQCVDIATKINCKYVACPVADDFTMRLVKEIGFFQRTPTLMCLDIQEYLRNR
jgi:hypothetical protein